MFMMVSCTRPSFTELVECSTAVFRGRADIDIDIDIDIAFRREDADSGGVRVDLGSGT